MAFDPKKPVQTRDGRPVRILCTDRPGDNPIVCLIGDEGMLGTRKADGSVGGCPNHSRDLVNVPERVSSFIPLYKRPSDVSSRYVIPGSCAATMADAIDRNSGDGSTCDIIEVITEDNVVVETKLHPGKGALANRE